MAFAAGVIAVATSIVQTIVDDGAPPRDKILMLSLVSAGLVISAFSVLLLYHVARVAGAALGATTRATHSSDLTSNLLLTAFSIAVLIVNTALLNEFYRGLFPQLIPVFGIALPLSMMFSTMYSVSMVMFGMTLQRLLAKSRETGRLNIVTILTVALCVISVLNEMILFGILSFAIHWPWPTGLDVPPWVDGWLAVMGLILGGGAVAAGYQVTKAWRSFLMTKYESFD